MPAFVTLESLSAATPDGDILFADLTLAIGAERIGLVGRNGSGKSTLLRVIEGRTAPAAGSIGLTGSVGRLSQEWPAAMSVAEALGLDAALAVISRITSGEGSVADFEKADWNLTSAVDTALVEVGLPTLDLDRRMGSFSGGERTRIGIARLLIERPDLLLLDEPTNNLDAAGREAVGRLIAGWQGGVLAASHDRRLLEMMDRIVELSPVGIRIVGGGWSEYASVREVEHARATAELERSSAAMASARRGAQDMREAKDRRDKVGRAFAAKNSEPKILLGRMAERAENSTGQVSRVTDRLVTEAEGRLRAARERIEVLDPLTIALPPTGLPSNADLLKLDAATVLVNLRMMGPWSLHMRGRERVAVTGPNGSGKTTLLKAAVGSIPVTGGAVTRAEGKIAMLDQHVSLLDPDDTILANFLRLNPEATEQEGYAACARFAFRNRDALKIAAVLSGGERLRASLACTLAGDQSPWLLILDEPTNHLDIGSIEILESALREYDGALLVVSHDEAFLEAIGIERSFDVITDRDLA